MYESFILFVLRETMTDFSDYMCSINDVICIIAIGHSTTILYRQIENQNTDPKLTKKIGQYVQNV